MELTEKIRRELTAIAFANTEDYCSVEEGQLLFRDWQALSKEQLAAVASVEKSSTGLKLKLYDKMKALELLGKMLGLFEGGLPRTEENNLLEAILSASREEVDTCDLPEIQQAADPGHDLVEQAGA